MNQEELVRRLQRKDIMAFERLYNMYRDNVYGVVNTIVRDTSLAEEIVQDVFARVWNNAHNYGPLKGRFFSWVLRIARKEAIDKLCATSHENNPSAGYLADILNENNEGHLADRIDDLKKLAKNLEQENLEIFDLLYFKGYSQRKTADVLGLPVNKVQKGNRNSVLTIRDNMSFEWM